MARRFHLAFGLLARKSSNAAIHDNIDPPNFRAAHFLANPREYFAVIGTIYLFGRIQQPPFDCAIPAARQPQFLAFLASQFGPYDCR